jgi:hypothetical protein
MNQFTQVITNELDKFINSFLLQLSSNQSISIDILEKEWNDFCSRETKVVITSTKKSNQEKIKCAYIFSKGKNTGEQCSKFVKDSQTFCYLHNLKEEKKEEKKEQEDVSNCLFKLTGTNYWWHKDTRLVFPSQTEKLVIAKYFNGDLQKLEDEDIKICKKFKLNYDQQYNFKKMYELETSKTNKTTTSENKSEIELKSVKEVESKTPAVKQVVEKKVESKTPAVKQVVEKKVESKTPAVKQVVEKKVENKPPAIKQVVEKKVENKPPAIKQVIEGKPKASKIGNSKDIINFNYSVMPIENVLKKIYDDSDESVSDEYTSEESESSTDSSDEDSDSFNNSNNVSDIHSNEDSDNDESENEDDTDSDEESELLEEED